jgi:zinc transport system permease protein
VEFFSSISNHTFLLNALLGGLLASIACGIMGTYVVTRRITFMSGGIAHTVLGGMGVAYYYGLHPLHGAIVAALIAAFLIGFISLKSTQHEDTLIGALWAIGMAVGIIFISRTPGYNADLMSYLFGNILMVTREDLWLIAGLDIVIVGLVILFYRKFLALCFDEEFAELQGLKVQAYYILLLCLIALTVVILIYVVGLILVIALLTLPAAIAGHYGKSLPQIMIIASVLGICFTFLGLGFSYGPDLPAGATIIIIAGLAYVISLGYRNVRARLLRKKVQ